MENLEIQFGKFEKYLDEKEYVYTKKRELITMFQKVQIWEDLIGIAFDSWQKKTIMNLYENGINPTLKDYKRYKECGIGSDTLNRLAAGSTKTSYFTFTTRINRLNEVLDFLNREDLKICTREFKIKVKVNTTSLFTRRELIDLCDTLANPQDKFILYALFRGIRGNKYSDLLELKVSDINLETKEITLPSGIVIKMDDYLEDLVTDLIDPMFGKYYYKLNAKGSFDVKSKCEFNMRSEYLLKVVPSTRNNNGLGHMSYQGIQTRIKTLSEVLGVKLLGTDIYKSGILYEMFKTKENWIQAEIEEFLKEHNYTCTVYEAKMGFDEKYGEKED